MPVQYSFPTLKIKEILICMRELEIPLSQEELKVPTREKMLTVYEAFLDILMGVSREEMKQAPPNLEVAIQVFQHQELHEDSVSEMTFFKKLMELLQAAGISDCTISDFVNPEYMRTKKILSGLINFAKFREERLAIFQESTARTYELRDIKQSLEEENEALEEQLANLRKMRQNVEPVIKELEQDNADLVASLEELIKENTTLRDGIREIKNTLEDVNTQVANDNFLVLEKQQEMEKLQSQIVRSPEKLKRALSTMSEDSNDKRVEIEELTLKLRDLEAHARAVKKLDNKLVKRISAAQECGQNLDRIKDLHKAIKKQQSTISDNEQAITELTASAEYLHKQVSHGQDKLFQLQRNFETKRYEVQQALEEMEREKLELEHSTQQDKNTISQNSMHNSKVHKEMEKGKLEHESEMTLLRTRYGDFQNQLDEYHNCLRSALAM